MSFSQHSYQQSKMERQLEGLDDSGQSFDSRCYQLKRYLGMIISPDTSTTKIQRRKSKNEMPIIRKVLFLRSCRHQKSSLFRSLVLSTSMLLLSRMLSSPYTHVHSYPMVIQVDEQSERCIRFNIPDGDDAHIAAVAIPSQDEMEDDNETVEDWYVSQVYSLCKHRGKHQQLGKDLPDDLPDNVMNMKSNYMKEQNHGDDSPLRIKITGTPSSDPKTFQHNYNMKYFKASILNYVGRTTDARAKKPNPGHQQYRTGSDHLEGYAICFQNIDREKQVQIVFDVVVAGDTIYDGDAIIDDPKALKKGSDFTKERHLTPLEMALDQSIKYGNTILREMQYMEAREKRMRQTSESINVRVRWFSYLSVTVLLVVTYVQVTYLKRYFHKKKLM